MEVNIQMDFTAARARLVLSLRREITDEGVLDAVEKVPRELFVPPSQREYAYEDRPLPIGHGQTISQPFIIALMVQAMELKGGEKVLEVGTGSGYQAAILAHIADYVVTVERYGDLADKAAAVLRRLGYANIEVHEAKSRLGWREAAPYDAIVVAAGAPMVPQELLDQLKNMGRLVIPVGSRYEQDLLQVVKNDDDFTYRNLGPCRWVPLVGEGAWDDVGDVNP